MPRYSMRDYRRYSAGILKHDVFSGLWFKDAEMREIVYDSYMMNLDPIVEYATSKHLNVKRHITEIKEILLQSKGVYRKSQIGK